MKNRNKIGMSILVISLFLSFLLPTFAQERLGSITLFYHGTMSDQQVPLRNASFALYPYAYKENDAYVICEAFHDSTVSILENSSNWKKAASKLYAYAQEQEIENSVYTTNANGIVHIENRKPGIYLLAAFLHQQEGGIFISSPFLVEIPDENNAEVRIEPKAEYFEQSHIATIGLRDLTSYTGGNETNGHLSGFPEPRYTGIPKEPQFLVNGEPWEETGYPFQVIYSKAKEEGQRILDTSVYVKDDHEAGLYIAHITAKNKGALILMKDRDDPDGHWQLVTFQTAVYTIRGVSDPYKLEQINKNVSEAEIAYDETQVLSFKQRKNLEQGLATVLLPQDSVLTVNGDASLGVVQPKDSALLFDDLLDPENSFYLLEERARQTLQKQHANMTNRKYQSKYLDLIQNEDGNLWLSSSKGCIVYWPYPKGTDKNTKFTLFHYQGLHREYGIKGNASLIDSIPNAQESIVELEQTEYGIRFYVSQEGFGPFVLSWSDETISEQDETQKNTVATGDKGASMWYIGILVSSCVLAILHHSRKNMDFD